MKCMNDYILQHRSGVENRYYVYVHRKLITGDVFYVGKGCGSRAWNSQGRNKYWNNVSNKYGYYVEILEDCLPEQLSLEREIFYISELGSTSKLTNMTTGGDSPVFKEDSRLKMSMSRKGKKFTEEHKQSMRDSYAKRDHTEARKMTSFKLRDKNIYTFQNIESLEYFTGTRHTLCEKYGLSAQSLRGLFLSDRKRNHSQKWRLVNEPNNQEKTNLE